MLTYAFRRLCIERADSIIAQLESGVSEGAYAFWTGDRRPREQRLAAAQALYLIARS